MAWGFAEHISHLEKLLVPDLIGNYKSFEVTEIVGFHEEDPSRPSNFMSLLVAEPSLPPDGRSDSASFLNEKPIELRGTPWKFGVFRYRVPTEKVIQELQKLNSTGEWSLGSKPLKVGDLTPMPPQFVPSDQTEPHPWNGVLKNNFWEGSHVLELFDGQKTGVKFLLDEPKLLKELATEVRSAVKIGIDGLSDRLGNVLIQLPVTVVTTEVSSSDNGDYLLRAIWREGSTERKLRVSCEKYEDSTVEGFGSETVTALRTSFPLYLHGGGARYVLWDDQYKLIMGASAQTIFITSFGINFSVMGGGDYSREFFVPLKNGTLRSVAVPLKEKKKPRVVGVPVSTPREPWRENRVFRDSVKRMRERKEFVQYGGVSAADKEDALSDIRKLIGLHGEVGAWLWDPYLDAKDVLSTLFYCPHKDADLRALTAGSEPPIEKKEEHSSGLAAAFQRVRIWLRSQPFAKRIGLRDEAAHFTTKSWQDRQRDIFNSAMGNCEGLHLEFRIRKGGAGWPFHDRFLIFPSETGPAKAWSLGTSVNSFGQKHHILQKVADGELIRQAFLDLWDELDSSEYIVWSVP
ncbi:MAG: VPA1262 family N-terminal domain-containing protein [Thalassolituus sp.]|jgi:hypothetical protein